ncbi:hypothetical protein GCM10027162_33210 [Streptomyces incanus]
MPAAGKLPAAAPGRDGRCPRGEALRSWWSRVRAVETLPVRIRDFTDRPHRLPARHALRAAGFTARPLPELTHRSAKHDRLRGFTTMVLARPPERLTFVPLRPLLRA